MGPLDYENTWINLVDRSQECPENNPGAVAINSSLRILFVLVSTITQQLLQNPLKGQDCATAAAFWGFPWNKLKFASLDLTCPATVEKPRYRPVPLFSFTLLLRIHVALASQLRSPVRVLDVMGSSWDQALKGVILWKTFSLALQYIFLYY